MPTYEYACRSCGAQLEVVQSFTDDALTTCGACGGALRKVFSAVGISFKGSGFYKTDSRKSSSSSSGSSSSSTAGDGASTSSTGGSGGSSGSDGGGSGTGGSGTGSSDGGGSGTTATPAATKPAEKAAGSAKPT